MKWLIFTILLLSISVMAQTKAVVGTVKRHSDFPSKFVKPRHLDVSLPPSYATNPKKKYPVLYMHDGQMLFDWTTTWNKQEWQVDEMMTKLIAENKIREAIVVGVWNTDKRVKEYMPQKAFAMATAEQKAEAAKFGITEVESENYLKFLVMEVKPFIDKNYRTLKGQKDTLVMGSSMGGLISLYAISEYPKVFGGAGCVSTHFPIANGVMIEYMKTALPSPKDHKIYFDYGTETLDSTYEPFQIKADEVMKAKGFTAKNWLTRKFQGDDHSEKSWAKRLDIPLIFLLGK